MLLNPQRLRKLIGHLSDCLDMLEGSATAPEHLSVTTTNRGFDHMDPIPSEYGGEVTVYESSAAMEACIWLNASAPAHLNEPTGPMVEAPMHLTLTNARRLAEQITALCDNHYQGER